MMSFIERSQPPEREDLHTLVERGPSMLPAAALEIARINTALSQGAAALVELQIAEERQDQAAFAAAADRLQVALNIDLAALSRRIFKAAKESARSPQRASTGTAPSVTPSRQHGAVQNEARSE